MEVLSRKTLRIVAPRSDKYVTKNVGKWFLRFSMILNLRWKMTITNLEAKVYDFRKKEVKNPPFYFLSDLKLIFYHKLIIPIELISPN